MSNNMEQDFIIDSLLRRLERCKRLLEYRASNSEPPVKVAKNIFDDSAPSFHDGVQNEEVRIFGARSMSFTEKQEFWQRQEVLKKKKDGFRAAARWRRRVIMMRTHQSRFVWSFGRSYGIARGSYSGKKNSSALLR